MTRRRSKNYDPKFYESCLCSSIKSLNDVGKSLRSSQFLIIKVRSFDISTPDSVGVNKLFHRISMTCKMLIFERFE